MSHNFRLSRIANPLVGPVCVGLLLSAFLWPRVAAAQQQCDAALTLPQLEQSTLSRNPDVAVVRDALHGAEADVTTARERPNPTMTLGVGGYNPRKGIGSGSALDKTLDESLHIDHPFELGGKRSLREQMAKAGVDAAGADLAEQKRQSLLAARSAYYDFLQAQSRLAIESELVDLQTQSLQALQQRHAAGDVSAIDVARVQVEVSKAQSERRQAQADLASAGIVLAYLTGCDAQISWSADGDWPAADAEAFDGDADISARSDVAAASARVTQADRGLALAKAQRTRDISIGFDLSNQNDPNSADGDNQSARPVFGLDLTIPLFAYHRYEGEIARAESDRDAASDQLTRAKAQAAADLQQAKNAAITSADLAQREHAELLPQAQSAADAVEYAYTRGALPLVDLLDARRTLRMARLDSLEAQADYARALAAWRAATERYAQPPKAGS
jgi:cobalt-zinc-cadmium efflux system outer membrane protein